MPHIVLPKLATILIASVGSLVYHIIVGFIFAHNLNSLQRDNAKRGNAFGWIFSILLLIVGLVCAIIFLKWWAFLFGGIGVVIMFFTLLSTAVSN